MPPSVPAAPPPPLPPAPAPPLPPAPAPPSLWDATLPHAAVAPDPTATNNHIKAELDRMDISRALIDTEAVSAPQVFTQGSRRGGARHHGRSCADLRTNDYLGSVAARARGRRRDRRRMRAGRGPGRGVARREAEGR